MSNTAIIPAWEDLALDSKSISTQTGFAFALKNTVTHGVPHLRPFNIGNDGLLDLSKIVYIPEKSINNFQTYWLQPGDILFNNTNSVELVGKSALISAPMECVFSNHITRLRPRDKNALDPAWLALYLRILWKNGFFAEQCHRWIGQAGFNATELARLKIPLPPLNLQQKIIYRVDALLTDLREAQRTLESMRQDIDQVMDSVLLEVFNGTNRNWPNKAPFGELVTISAHQVDPQDPDYKWLPHIGGESIESKSCRLSTYQTAEEDQVTSSKYLFEPGVVLYSKIRPYLRKVAFADFRGLCSADIYPLSIRADKQDELLPRFLMWSMVADPFTNYVNAKSGRARMPKINRQELFSYELFFPDRTEQQYIINYLDSTQESVDNLREMLQEDKEVLQQVEQSILERAFRGEL